MKKLLLMTSLFLAACAWGQTNPKIIDFFSFEGIRSLIPEFSYGGKINLYDAHDDPVHKIDIYDENFEVFKTISVNDEGLTGNAYYYYGVQGVGYKNYDNGYYTDYLFLTQTLFNDDDKFEYIVPILIEDRQCGFYVKTEGDAILQTVKFEEDLTGFIDRMIKINGKVFLFAAVHDSNDKGKTIIYEIDKQSNAIKKVATHTGMKVHPTVANPSEPITIELGEDTDIHEIHVVNAAGQTVKRIPVNEGQRQVVIKSQGLSQGMNIINATGPQQKYNSKIFVK
ncbi:MAG: hypothetical protein IJP70_11240 [Bacteroidales bacterium]|nr:hypothetical protein [Bacteroidales bacterium]